MKVKFINKNPFAIIGVFLLMFMCAPLVDMCNGMESSMYKDVKNAKSFERWFECMKYIDKYPNGEHIEEVSKIFYEELKKEGNIYNIYIYGEKYSSIPLGEKLKELAYEVAVEKNTQYAWRKYIEVADSEHIKDAEERLLIAK